MSARAGGRHATKEEVKEEQKTLSAEEIDAAFQFNKEERVLCFHGPMLYEAKVLDREYKEASQSAERVEGPYYFVHYRGWKASWDEWVSERRLIKFNEEGLKKQAELKASMDTKKKAPAATAKTTVSQAATKRKAEDKEKEEEFVKKPEIKMMIPDALKVKLVDDWEFVTKQQKLVPLPRDLTVTKLCDLYVTSKTKRSNGRESRTDELLNEVMAGIKDYFNRCLGNVLLYRFEREQYMDVKRKNPDAQPCDVYGPEHLLRMFVHMPTFLAHTNLDAEAIAVVREHLIDFYKFLNTNEKEFFVAYENADPSYVSIQRNA